MEAHPRATDVSVSGWSTCVGCFPNVSADAVNEERMKPSEHAAQRRQVRAVAALLPRRQIKGVVPKLQTAVSSSRTCSR
eukprot:scaffold437_cov159-Amphora_coffeaeformis.AAC.25